jgi:hypothetical protein
VNPTPMKTTNRLAFKKYQPAVRMKKEKSKLG